MEETDDAYVAGNVVQITPQVAGTVTAIQADDTQMVKAGQPLVMLDQAEAKLAQTVREVRTTFLNNGALQAAVSLRETELAPANEDLQRREQVAASGAVPAEEIAHASTALNAAQANLAVANDQLAANRAPRPACARPIWPTPASPSPRR